MVRKIMSVNSFVFLSFISPFVISLLIRIFLCFSAKSSWYQVDSVWYIKQAFAIKEGSWLNIWPNGYPLIIAFVSSVFRFVELDILLIWTNIILSTATIGLIYFISYKITQNWAFAGLTSLAVGLWPNQLNYVNQFLSEVPATFFLVSGIALIVSGKNTLLSSLLIGFSATIRSALAPVPILMAALFIWKRKFNKALILLIASIVPIIAMSSYSYFRIGDFAIGGNSAPNILVALDSYGGDVDTKAWEASVNNPNFSTLSDALKEYFRYLFRNPHNFLKQRVSAFWELWGFWPSDRKAELGGAPRSDLARLLIGLRFPLLLLAIFYIIKKRRREVFDFLLLIPALSLTMIHTFLFAKARYTFPAEPLLMILAMRGLMMIFLLKHIQRWSEFFRLKNVVE